MGQIHIDRGRVSVTDLAGDLAASRHLAVVVRSGDRLQGSLKRLVLRDDAFY